MIAGGSLMKLGEAEGFAVRRDGILTDIESYSSFYQLDITYIKTRHKVALKVQQNVRR